MSELVTDRWWISTAPAPLLRPHAKNVGQHALDADATFQRLGHCLRLLEDLLLHVVVVLAALHGVSRHFRGLDRPLRQPAIAVHDAVTGGVDGHQLMDHPRVGRDDLPASRHERAQ